MRWTLFFILMIAFYPIIGQVKVAGAMHRVMQSGDLSSNISLDSLEKTAHLYGLGPLENLKGEIMIYDGRSYVSKVSNNNSLIVSNHFDISAPFFVYSVVDTWREIDLPDAVHDLESLENFLDELNVDQPFTFRIEGEFSIAEIHVQNLPDGTVINSPQEAHTGQINQSLPQQSFRALGYYSTSHKGIFTHHDSHIHIHLLTGDSKKMGHADRLEFDPHQVKLWHSR